MDWFNNRRLLESIGDIPPPSTARMIAEDVGETERLALVGLSPELIEEVEFNADVFDTTRADFMHTRLNSPFFNVGESR